MADLPHSTADLLQKRRRLLLRLRECSGPMARRRISDNLQRLDAELARRGLVPASALGDAQQQRGA